MACALRVLRLAGAPARRVARSGAGGIVLRAPADRTVVCDPRRLRTSTGRAIRTGGSRPLGRVRAPTIFGDRRDPEDVLVDVSADTRTGMPGALPTRVGGTVNDPIAMLKRDHREVEELLTKLGDSK